MENKKICSYCKITKDIDKFYKNNSKFTSWCKKCYQDRSEINKKNNYDKNKNIVFLKICSVCGEEKFSTEFGNNYCYSDGKVSSCRKCRSIILKNKHRKDPRKQIFSHAKRRSQEYRFRIQHMFRRYYYT